MRTLIVAGAAICLLILVRESTGGMHAQTTPPQSAPPTSQADGRGRGPQGPPLLPTPPLTAPPTPDKDGNFVIGPPYTPAPELTVKEGVPQGKIHEFTMDSKDSKIYPGIARSQPGAVVPYTRQVAVYVPAQYVAGTPAPFIVAQDGMSAHYRGNLPPILDNLIHEKRVPPIVAVMVHNGGGDAQGSQRGLEYDTVSGVYTDFIETEVLPRITRDYGIVFTKDPEGRATMGGSSGAACAFTMAWFHPELYRKVLSYSGTYVNQQSPLNPDVAAWRMGVPRDAHPQQSSQADPRLDARERARQPLHRSGRHLAQLGAGERADGRRAQSQGLQISVRLFPGLTARRPRRRRADPARSPRMAVEGISPGVRP